MPVRLLVAALIVLGYPLVDRALGLGTLGAMLPILIYVMLALGRPIGLSPFDPPVTFSRFRNTRGTISPKASVTIAR